MLTTYQPFQHNDYGFGARGGGEVEVDACNGLGGVKSKGGSRPRHLSPFVKLDTREGSQFSEIDQ